MSSFRSFVDDERHVRVYDRVKDLRIEIFKSEIPLSQGYLGSGVVVMGRCESPTISR